MSPVPNSDTNLRRRITPDRQSSLTRTDAQFHLVLILPVAVAVLPRSLAAVADLIALIVAWKKASRVVRELSLYRVRILLGDVLVRDGELPFFVHEHGD